MASINNSFYFINDATIDQFTREVDEENYDRFLSLLTIFAKDIAHPYMQQSPTLCYRMASLMDTLLYKKGKISKELVDKVVFQFTKHKVFTTPGTLVDDMKFLCRDNQVVQINSLLLSLVSEQNKKPCSFPGTEKNCGFVDYSQQYHAATLEAMKSFLYSGTLPSADISTLYELHFLSRLMLYKQLEEASESALLEQASLIKTDEELECVQSLFSATDTDNQLSAHIMNRALKSYLSAKDIAFSPSMEEGCICLDVSQLGLLALDNTLGTLLRIYTNGLLVRHEDQLEALELLAFMPEQYRERCTELTFSFVHFNQNLVKPIASYFENITTLITPLASQFCTGKHPLVPIEALEGTFWHARQCGLSKVNTLHISTKNVHVKVRDRWRIDNIPESTLRAYDDCLRELPGSVTFEEPCYLNLDFYLPEDNVPSNFPPLLSKYNVRADDQLIRK